MLCFECTDLGRGLEIANALVESLDLDILEATLMGPSKFVGLMKGSADETRQAAQLWPGILCPGENFDAVFLENPDPRILDAILSLNCGRIEHGLFVLEASSFPKALRATDEILKNLKTEIVEFRTYRSGFNHCQILFSAPAQSGKELDRLARKFAGSEAITTFIEKPSERFLRFYN